MDVEGEPIALTVRDQITILAYPLLLSPDFVEEMVSCFTPPTRELPSRPALVRQSVPGNSLPLSERIKQAMSVFDFVSQYVELDRSNSGLRPFHDDERKSFQVDPRRNFCHCYAGCERQTVIDFERNWREKHGQSTEWKDVLHELAKRLLWPSFILLIPFVPLIPFDFAYLLWFHERMKDALTAAAFARYIKKDPKTVINWINNGLIEAKRVGRFWHIPISEIDVYNKSRHYPPERE